MSQEPVEVVPGDLRFRFALGKQLLSTITINNRSDSRTAFKIKTTAPKKYVVRPSSGVVEPRTSQAVQVIMQAQKEVPTDFASCKDKFMVQTTALADDEQIDKDTFSRDVRKDLREARLRVLLEGPPAPPSPVPEANEADGADGGVALEQKAGVFSTQPVPSRVATARSPPKAESAPSGLAEALKGQLAQLAKERDELRRKLDFVELQGGANTRAAPASGAATDSALKFRVSIVHIILVAIIAFLIGHYT